MIYCDYNATAPLRPEAREALGFALDVGANPSSVHSAGRKARGIVEKARLSLATAIGGRSEDIVFTSGGTEANALAIKGALALIDKPVVFVSGLEHPAVSAQMPDDARGVALKPTGEIDLDDLNAQLGTLADGEVPFLCLMLANNETGVIQPVQTAAQMVRDKGGYTHCDAVQALGKIPVNVGLLGVDYAAFSSHKLGGPQGVGALWFRVGAPLKPQLIGGGQERSVRSGTENVAGIAGFGAAVDASQVMAAKRVSDIRDQFEKLVSAAAPVVFFGNTCDRLPGTSCFALEGFASETQVMAMDLGGVAVSAGSACSSGKVKTSGVLTSMQVENNIARSALRVSFGWASEPSDAVAAAQAWIKAAKRAVPAAFRESA